MIAQLVEHDLAKVGVASSSLVHRSFFLCPGGGIGRRVRFRCVCREVCRFESCSGHNKTPIPFGAPNATCCGGESGGIGRPNEREVLRSVQSMRPDCRTRRAGGEIGIHATLRG